MDTVQEKLTEWGLEALKERFAERVSKLLCFPSSLEQLIDPTFDTLTEEDIKELIPVLGLRKKFLSKYKGHCLLFSTGIWQEADGQLAINWASQGYCNYTIFVGVVLFLVSFVQIYRLSMFLYKRIDSTFLSAFIDVLTGIWLCGMTIIAACIITFGFMAWCQNMTERFPSCVYAAGQDIDHKDEIDTKHFYIELGTAQFGVWGSFATWVGLSMCALLKLCRYHQYENIRVSMFRERQRLINENADSPSNSLGRESNSTQSTATAE